MRYWRFNKWYHSGYLLICLISQPLLIASRSDWYRSKGLLKGFKLALRPWESSKNWWRYGQIKFVTLGRRCRHNSGRLQRGQQAGKAWLGAHLDCITPIRFGVGGADKEATEYRRSMSDQLTIFSRGAFVTVCKGWHLREAMRWQSRETLWSFHNHQRIFYWSCV